MDAQIRQALAACSTATITMQLLKRGLRATAMRAVAPLAEGQERVVGEAYTMRFIPMREDLSDPAVLGAGDNAQRLAIEECPAGAVLVMDGLGLADVGTLGDILAERLRVRGVAACVTDSAVRDAEAVIATRLPGLVQRGAPPRPALPASPWAIASARSAAAGWRSFPATCWSATATARW